MNQTLRYSGALCGAAAVLSFLLLPVVQKTILWIGASRDGAWLIQRVLSSHNAEGITVGVILIAALLIAAAGSFLLVVSYLRQGLISSLSALALMTVLLVYFVAETGSTDGLAVGYWINFASLVVMSGAALLLHLYENCGVVGGSRARSPWELLTVVFAAIRERGRTATESPGRCPVKEKECESEEAPV